MDGYEAALRENLTEHQRIQRLQQAELVRLVGGDAWATVTVNEEDVLRLFRQNKARADRILWLDTMLVNGSRKSAQIAKKAEQGE